MIAPEATKQTGKDDKRSKSEIAKAANRRAMRLLNMGYVSPGQRIREQKRTGLKAAVSIAPATAAAVAATKATKQQTKTILWIGGGLAAAGTLATLAYAMRPKKRR